MLSNKHLSGKPVGSMQSLAELAKGICPNPQGTVTMLRVSGMNKPAMFLAAARAGMTTEAMGQLVAQLAQAKLHRQAMQDEMEGLNCLIRLALVQG